MAAGGGGANVADPLANERANAKEFDGYDLFINTHFDIQNPYPQYIKGIDNAIQKCNKEDSCLGISQDKPGDNYYLFYQHLSRHPAGIKNIKGVKTYQKKWVPFLNYANATPESRVVRARYYNNPYYHLAKKNFREIAKQEYERKDLRKPYKILENTKAVGDAHKHHGGPRFFSNMDSLIQAGIRWSELNTAEYAGQYVKAATFEGSKKKSITVLLLDYISTLVPAEGWTTIIFYPDPEVDELRQEMNAKLASLQAQILALQGGGVAEPLANEAPPVVEEAEAAGAVAGGVEPVALGNNNNAVQPVAIAPQGGSRRSRRNKRSTKRRQTRRR
jgi:hypothetical protein